LEGHLEGKRGRRRIRKTLIKKFIKDVGMRTYRELKLKRMNSNRNRRTVEGEECFTIDLRA